jgi:thiosulfate dehydrogenase [quinone] large subunit
MTVTHGHNIPTTVVKVERPDSTIAEPSRGAAVALAALRIGIGFVFLWAFLDKTFGLGYATGAAKAWLHGGSPTKGFLGAVDVGPLQALFHTWAGAGWTNWLFMLAMLGIGVAVIAGIALRPAAVAGTVVLALMWLAEFPFARVAADGTATGSTNPLVDYHVIYALALIVIAATQAGRDWGLGDRWARLPFVRDHRWAL